MKYLAFLLAAVFPFTVNAQNSYLCIADLSTGFSFDKVSKKWKSADFNVSGERFLLSKKNNAWEWKKFGQESTSYNCSKDFNEAGYLHCESLIRVVFNRKNLRFQSYYSIGYVNKGVIGNEGEDTPYITIGQCSPI